MGTVYRKMFTKPMPAGAKPIVRKGERFAEWRDAKGKRRTAPMTIGKDGTDRIVITAKTYTAKYRDGEGIVREKATGCRDEQAARSRLTDLEKRAEKVKGLILTPAEDRTIDHQTTPLAGHATAFIDHQIARGLSRRVNDTRSQLRRVSAECGWHRLGDLDGTTLEKWLNEQRAGGMAAGTANQYRSGWVAFANWCVRTGRLSTNPFAHVPKADEKADRRRTRRSLTEAELRRLLDVARRRPLIDRATIRRGPHKGEVAGNLRAETRRKLERLGWERQLIYKTMVLTGLRKGELAAVTVGQVELDGPVPHIQLDAAKEKNREGNTIPLRADLVADLREWLRDKAEKAENDAATVPFDPNARNAKKRNTGESGGVYGLPWDTPLFTVPAGLVRILDRDLTLAGIPKRDERGRTIDVHAIRHTYGTLLSVAGVSPRTAQAAMRHASLDMTMNVYTDPKLLDVAGAMEALPSLPLDARPQSEAGTLRATGTDDAHAESLAPKLAPKLAPALGNACTLGSIMGKIAAYAEAGHTTEAADVSAYYVNRKDSLTTAVNESLKWAAKDSNLRLPPCEDGALTN